MKKIEKSPLDPFVKWFFPKLLPYVPQWMTANVISSLGVVLCFLSALCLVFSYLSPLLYLVAALLFLLTWVTDTMDGIVARARGQQSKVGHYLDHFGDSWNIVFIGFGLFLTNGSHLVIGLACAVVYLMFHVDGHIKVTITDTLELPAFGPTEIRFVIASVMIAAAFIDPGQPWSWFPGMSGKEGWLTTALGFDRGMTFIDTAGFFAAVGGGMGLLAETVTMLVRFSRVDAQGKLEVRQAGAQGGAQRGARASTRTGQGSGATGKAPGKSVKKTSSAKGKKP